MNSIFVMMLAFLISIPSFAGTDVLTTPVENDQLSSWRGGFFARSKSKNKRRKKSKSKKTKRKTSKDYMRLAIYYFKTGKYNSAGRVLSKILKSNSRYKPALILLGRVYYRKGDMRKSAKSFSAGGLSLLSGDSALEYGLAHFAVKSYAKALKGFKKVPRNHPSIGIANLYSGIIYFKNKRIYDAERYIRAAKRIPKELFPSKRAYLQLIAEEQQRARRQVTTVFNPNQYIGVGAVQNNIFSDPTPSAPAIGQQQTTSDGGIPPPPDELIDDEEKAASASDSQDEDKKKSGLTYSVTPSLSMTQATKNSFFLQSNVESNTSTQSIGASLITTQLGEVTDVGQSSFSIPLAVSQITSSTNSEKLVIQTDQDGNSTPISSPSNEDESTQQIAVSPTYSSPIDSTSSFGLGISYTQTTTPSDTSTTITGDVKWGGELIGFTTSLNGNYSTFATQSAGTSHSHIKASTTLTGTVVSLPATLSGFYLQNSPGDTGALPAKKYESTIYFDSTFSYALSFMDLSGTFGYTSNTNPATHLVNGAETEMVITGKASKAFEFGFSAVGTYSMAQLGQYYRNLSLGDEGDVPVRVVTNGSKTVWSISVSMAPYSFLSISGSYSETEYLFDNIEVIDNVDSSITVSQNEFLNAVSDLQTSQNLGVKISYSF